MPLQRIINTQRQRLDGLIEETSKAPRRLQSKVPVNLYTRIRLLFLRSGDTRYSLTRCF